MANENKGAEMGEKALYGAFTAARDKRDLGREREIGKRLTDEYPKSQFVPSRKNSIAVARAPAHAKPTSRSALRSVRSAIAPISG